MTTFAIGGLTASILHAASGAGGRRKPTRSGAPNPTGAPVLRGSLEAGTFEDTFFAVPAKGEADKMLRVVRRALDAGRRLSSEARNTGRKLTSSERAIAALTGAAVRVYEELTTLARLNKGEVFPSYEWMAEATGLGRNTVARVIRILDRCGFLIRQRRFKRVEVEGEGRRYKQTSNAYRLMIPKAVLPYLPRWMKPAPAPCDEVQRETDRQEDQQHMLSSLTCRELARATVGGALGDVLARLGAGIDARSEANSASTEMILNR